MDFRKTSPKILYVTSHWSHWQTCASEIRSLNIARALSEVGRVDLIVIDAEKSNPECHSDPRGDLEVVHTLQLSSYPNQKIGKKFRWLVDPYIRYPHGCGVREGDSLSIVRLANDYDLIWFSKLRTANMFPCWKWERSVVDIDDIPSMFEYSEIKAKKKLSAKLIALLRYRIWRQRDSLLGDRFGSLLVCSKPDKVYLNKLNVTAPVSVIPNGFSASGRNPIRALSVPPRIGFIGIFDYEPNAEGIHWFVNECWPQIKCASPDVRLRLIGRQSDGPLKPAGADIEGLGWVDNPAHEVATWSAMIVPIRTGAGTRGKIAHGLSLKCPIVSTPLGAYGYDVGDGREMRLAESGRDFAAACIDILEKPKHAAAMAERGWRRYLNEWTWDAIRPAVCAVATESLKRMTVSATQSAFPIEMSSSSTPTKSGMNPTFPG